MHFSNLLIFYPNISLYISYKCESHKHFLKIFRHLSYSNAQQCITSCYMVILQHPRKGYVTSPKVSTVDKNRKLPALLKMFVYGS